LVADLDCYHTAYLSYEGYCEASKKLAPRESMCDTPSRKNMWLSQQLQEQMKVCENELKRLFEAGKIRNNDDVRILLNFSEHNRSQMPYMNIIGQLHLLAEYVDGKDSQTLEQLTITRHYLKKLHRALVIYHLTRDKDACQYLDSKIKPYSHNPFGNKIYLQVKKIIAEAPSMEEENPCLLALKQNIHDHLRSENGDTRVLVFVRSDVFVSFWRRHLKKNNVFEIFVKLAPLWALVKTRKSMM
jgi:hypothetical protein